MKMFGFEINRQKRSVDSDGNLWMTSSSNIPFIQFSGSSRTATSLSAVYACTNLISNTLAAMPVTVKNGYEVDPGHPVNSIFRNDNSIISWFPTIKYMVGSMLLKGNGYAYIERNGTRVVGLRVLDPSDVTINYDKRKNTLSYSIPSITNKIIEPKNLIHIRLYSKDGINGISVISAASDLIESAKATEHTAQSLFSKSGRLDGILKMVGGGNSADQKKSAKEAFLNSIGDGVAVLPSNVDYQSIQATSLDLDLINQRKYNALSICQFFNVPSVLIGLGDSNIYGSLEHATQAFNLMCISPIVRMMEDEFSRKLFLNRESEYRIDFDANYVIRTDRASAATYYATLHNAGVMSANEIRRELNMRPVDGGDNLVIPFSDVNQNKINNTENE